MWTYAMMISQNYVRVKAMERTPTTSQEIGELCPAQPLTPNMYPPRIF